MFTFDGLTDRELVCCGIVRLPRWGLYLDNSSRNQLAFSQLADWV